MSGLSVHAHHCHGQSTYQLVGVLLLYTHWHQTGSGSIVLSDGGVELGVVRYCDRRLRVVLAIMDDHWSFYWHVAYASWVATFSILYADLCAGLGDGNLTIRLMRNVTLDKLDTKMERPPDCAIDVLAKITPLYGLFCLGRIRHTTRRPTSSASFLTQHVLGRA